MSRARIISLAVPFLLLTLVAPAPAGAAAGTHHLVRQGTSLTAGYGRVTPAYRRTIDRVAADARAAGPVDRSSSARALVDAVVRCATFEGQRYCLGSGWTDRTQAQVRAQAVSLLERPAARPMAVTTTGDLSAYDALRQAARLSPTQRAAAERAELTEAARSVAKVWLIRHQIQRVPLPRGFFAHHPEVRRTVGRTSTGQDSGGIARFKPWRAYPTKATVLHPAQVTAQSRTYWCGPTSMQMIAWGWQQKRRSQQHWATRLGTTTSGTAITSMVRVVNDATGYDKATYAGPYITLDIGDWTFNQWKLLIARHVVDYHAPVVLHPVLLARFYPYLDHDGSGHFQVGRGYKKRPGKTPLLGYFEPWNQQRFHPDEPFVDRVQWRDAYRSYRANEAHFQHDIGV
ncbi:MAG TPA: C39 family peptidase [Nocardioides sp.]|nr:C39 family peptidase [Nocardioides sp.]